MKAVILAAGKGTRMKPLTEDTPKPLLPVAGKPIIEHNIEEIEDEVDEIIIIAGFKKEQFEQRYGDKKNIKILEQEKPLGTADAALEAKDQVKGSTLILNGDDIYGKELKKLANQNSAVLSTEIDDPTKYGVFELEDGEVTKITEKPEDPPSKMANTGAFVVKESFFNLLEQVKQSERGEYEITDALRTYIENERLKVVEAENWLPCSYPWQLLEANQSLMEKNVSETSVKGEVDKNTQIKGNVVIEEGAKIKEFSTIEGPAIIKSGCVIGPRAHIRPGTVLEKNIKVGNSEVKNTVVREGSSMAHFNYVGDSYLGKDVNLGAGVKIANLKNDGSKIDMIVKGERIKTSRSKLGAIVGSQAKIGVNSSINPGRKVGFKSITDSNEKVNENLPNNSLLSNGEIHEDWN